MWFMCAYKRKFFESKANGQGIRRFLQSIIHIEMHRDEESEENDEMKAYYVIFNESLRSRTSSSAQTIAYTIEMSTTILGHQIYHKNVPLKIYIIFAYGSLR